MTSTVDEMFHSKYANNKEHIILQSIIHTSKMLEDGLWLKLMDALNFWFKIPKDKFEKIVKIVQLIQITNNTLNDASEKVKLQQGKPTAFSAYGLADALNSGFYAIFVFVEKIQELGGFKATKIGNEYILSSTKSQGMEIYWRDYVICPSEKEYLDIAARKTEDIIKLAIKLMQLFSENKADFNKLANILGIFFHIFDDYTNLRSIKKHFIYQNGLCCLSEGKFSLPVIHAIHTHPEATQLKSMLCQKPMNEEVLKYYLNLLENFESFEYTKQMLYKYRENAEEEMKNFEKNPHLSEIFKSIFSIL